MKRRQFLATPVIAAGIAALPALAVAPQKRREDEGWTCRRGRIDDMGLVYIVWHKMTDDGFVVRVEDPRALLKAPTWWRSGMENGVWTTRKETALTDEAEKEDANSIREVALELLTPWARMGNNVHIEIRKDGARYDTDPTILAEDFIRRQEGMLCRGMTLGYNEIRKPHKYAFLDKIRRGEVPDTTAEEIQAGGLFRRPPTDEEARELGLYLTHDEVRFIARRP